MLYEDPTKDITSDERFHVELHFSPGVNCCVQKELPPGPGYSSRSKAGGAATKNATYSTPDRIDGTTEPTTPPPPLVCSIKCSKDSFVNVFEKQTSMISSDMSVFDESQDTSLMETDQDLDIKESCSSAVSDPIEIKVTSSKEEDESGKVS